MSDRALKRRPTVSDHGAAPDESILGGVKQLKRPVIEDVIDEANKVAKELKRKFKKPQLHCAYCSCTDATPNCKHADGCCRGSECNMQALNEE